MIANTQRQQMPPLRCAPVGMTKFMSITSEMGPGLLAEALGKLFLVSVPTLIQDDKRDGNLRPSCLLTPHSPKKLESELSVSGWEGVADCAERARSRELIGGVEVCTIEGVVHLSPELKPRNITKPPVLLN